MRNIKKMLVVGGVAAAALGLMATQASADPGSTPSLTGIVGTGSDTTQLVLDQLAADYNSSHTTSPQVASWDAVGSSPIIEKTGCASRPRPNGSGAGIAELEANLKSTGTGTPYCVDFARSSRARVSGSDPTSIVFIPFALDAVTWSANSTSNAPGNLTTTQLKAIYSCDASVLGTGKTGAVTWDEVGGTGTAAVVPVIPQSNSGTRAFFLGQIGVTTLGSCVLGTDNSVEENEGTNAVFGGTNAPNVIFPYSVAVYLAQSEHGHGSGDQGSLTLKSVNGTAPTTGTAPNATINSSFPYVRDVYNVVRNASTAPARSVPTNLQDFFGHGANTGWICTNSTASADISSFGFLPLSNCGILQ